MSSDIALARPFVQATINVLAAMSGITAVPGTPFVKKDNTARGDVSAIVGVTGEKKGAVALSFSQSCAIAVVRGMLGDDIEDILTDTRDAVGEITNMISGQARASLSEMGLSLQGSTPSIIFGERHTLSFPGKATIVAIPFSTEHGDFTLEFHLEQAGL
jgi:chemotaxis protein CheX